MAKVVVEFDTVTKAISASMDGAPLADLEELTFWRSYDGEEYGCRVVQATEDRGHKLRTLHVVQASDAVSTAVARYLGRE